METNSGLLQHIRARAHALLPHITTLRQHIHAHPELSFQEFETATFVETQLQHIGISSQRVTETGIVALIAGKNPDKKIIALRADLDALPIAETNTTAYASKNTGVMHACGHDVHAASLLGVAQILFELRDTFEGTVKLIFQPGEEKLPGGASLMIAAGVLENPTPESIFAQHVFPSLPAGKVGFRSGMYMASTDEVYLTIAGKGGHAAMPADYINPLLIASAVLLELDKLFMQNDSRIAETNEIPTVLAFGKIEGKGATNVIPNHVAIEGTFRTMDEQWRTRAHELMQARAQEVAEDLGGTCTLRIERGYPFLVNHELLTVRARDAAEIYLGKDNVVTLEKRMTAEDFAYFSQVMPACFYRLGTASPDGKYTSGVHTPNFDIDEQALETSVGLLAWLTLHELKETNA